MCVKKASPFFSFSRLIRVLNELCLHKNNPFLYKIWVRLFSHPKILLLTFVQIILDETR